jgi:hypothetical protein
MASKKKNVEQRIQARKAFVASNPNLSPAEARKRFYVQTRAQELSAAGKAVDRKALRQKFESGGVTREGFYTPADIQRAAAKKAVSTSSSSGTLPSTGKTGRTADVTRGKAYTDINSIERQAIQKRISAPKNVTPTRTNRGSNPVESAALRLTDPNEWKKAVTGTGKSWLGAGKRILGFASSQGESLNATFVNPAINTVGRAVGKNPNLRQATGTEALLNTADVVATIYSGGAAKGLVPSGGALLNRLSGRSRTVRTVQKAVTALKGEAKLWSKADDLGRSVSAQVRGADYVRPVAPGKRTAVNEVAESATTKVVGKKAATPRPARKYRIGGMSDAAEDAKMAKLSKAEKEMLSGKGDATPRSTGKSPVAKKATAKKAAPAKKAPAKKKAASQSVREEGFSEMVSADVRQGDAYLYNPADDVPAMKASTSKPAKTTGKSPVAKKATTKKATTKKAASPRSTTVTPTQRPNLGTKFGSQEEFDKFMDVQGGGEQMRKLARTNPQAAESFQRNNAQFIRARQTRRTVAENQRLAAQAKRQAEINARNAETKKKLGLK